MQPPYPEKPLCPVCKKNRMARTAKRCGECSQKDGGRPGITPKQRLKFKFCGAIKKHDGKPCKAFAGLGTDHLGIGKCKDHGGNLPSHRKHAVLVEATQRMVTLGEPIADIEPHRALAGLLRATAGSVAWIRAEIGDLEDLSSFESRVLVQLYDSERDRLQRIASACIAGGIAERVVRIEEAKMATMGKALSTAAEKAGLDGDQRRALGSALREELTRLAAAEDEIEDDDPLWETPDWEVPKVKAS